MLKQLLGGDHSASVVSAVQDTMGNVEAWEQAELMRGGPWLRPQYPTDRANDPSSTVVICVVQSERPFSKGPPPAAGPPSAGPPFPGYRFALYYVFDDGTVWPRVLLSGPPKTVGPPTAR